MTLDEFNQLVQFLKETGFPLVRDVYKIFNDFEFRALVNAWVVLNSYSTEPKARQFLKIYNEVLSMVKP